jgi:hypothetical protein
MSVDAVGFSEAVVKDERAGLEAMQATREDRIGPAVRRHSGTRRWCDGLIPNGDGVPIRSM